MTRSSRKGRQPPFLHRTLHLQRHQHSGKLLKHKHTSYRSLAVLLVITGILLAFLRVASQAAADSLTLYVYARNPAPVPTTPAVIEQPSDGYATQNPLLTVSGTCPVITPQVSIAIIDNGDNVGSTPCDSNNNFTIIITLTPGQNSLVARSFTITGDSGPDSTPVGVTYTPLVLPTPPAKSSTNNTTPPGTPTTGSSTTAVSPLLVTASQPFVIFGPGKSAVWTGTITGGMPPYTINIDWGDGGTHTYLIKTPGETHFSHRYSAMHSYVITLHVTDRSGQSVVRQYAAITPYIAPLSTTTLPTPHSPFSGLSPLALYGAYLLLLAILGAFWVRAHPFCYAPLPAHARIPANGSHKKRRNHR